MAVWRCSLLFLSISLLAIVGCNTLSDLVSVDPKELLTLESSAASAPADGFTRVTLTARIPAATPSTDRMVSFAATDGQFLDGDGGTTATVAPDVNGIATIDLTSPTSVGPVTITATARGITRRLTIEFTASAGGLLQLEVSPATAPADNGQTVVTLTARAPVTRRGEVVEFSTSLGMISADSVAIDNNGRAVNQLASPSAPGTAIVQATLGTFNVTRTVVFTSASPSGNLITLNVSRSSLPADGVSQSTVTASIPTSFSSRTVTFSATGGTLHPDGDPVTVGVNGQAQAVLTSDTTPGTSVVTATASINGTSVSASRTVTFTAVGGAVSVSASPASIAANGVAQTTVTARIPPSFTNRTVNFTTTGGMFVDSQSRSTSSTADSSGRAIVVLQSGTQVTTALVTASSGTVSDTQTVSFTQAVPDVILLSTTEGILDGISVTRTTLTATAFSGAGLASDNITINFRIVDAATLTVFGGGSFSPTSGLTNTDPVNGSPQPGVATTEYHYLTPVIATGNYLFLAEYAGPPAVVGQVAVRLDP